MYTYICPYVCMHVYVSSKRSWKITSGALEAIEADRSHTFRERLSLGHKPVASNPDSAAFPIGPWCGPLGFWWGLFSGTLLGTWYTLGV